MQREGPTGTDRNYGEHQADELLANPKYRFQHRRYGQNMRPQFGGSY